MGMGHDSRGVRSRRVACWLAATLALANCGPKRAVTSATALPPVPAFDPANSMSAQFSGEKALALADRITGFGPRPSGAAALERCRQFFEAELKALGWVTARQAFEDTTPRGRINFVNLRARFPGSGDPWARAVPLIIASHYDTKFFGTGAFVGANDGSSGNAVMLEMARLLAQQPPRAQRIELVFFDGEEASVAYTPLDGLHGSRFYSKQLRSQPREQRPSMAVVLDMVGDRDLHIGIPPNSSDRLRRLALAAADDAGTRAHFGTYAGEILDDHVPLAMAGLEVTNFIDLDFPPWHTPGDTMDKISAGSLAISGKTALLLVEKFLLK